MDFLRQDLSALTGYQRPLEAGRGARLHLNEASADWPLELKAELASRLLRLPFQQYPERQDELTERVRERLGRPAGTVLLGPSGGAVLDLVALAGLRPGDAVAVPDPGFTLYPLLVQRHGGRVHPVPVGMGFPLAPWQAAAAQCRQLWLTLPNNPTGAFLLPRELAPLLEEAAARNPQPLVVLDEAYVEFAGCDNLAAIDRYPNVLVARTFSKALASASFRLGYLVGRPELIGRLAALQLPFSIPAASLEALDLALSHAALFERAARETARRRDRLAAALGSRTIPSAANFLLVRPDPTAQLAAVGLHVRSLPELGAARITVGDEPSCAAVARTLDLDWSEEPPCR